MAREYDPVRLGLVVHTSCLQAARNADPNTVVSDTLRMQQDYIQTADMAYSGLRYLALLFAEFQPEYSGCEFLHYLSLCGLKYMQLI